MVSELTQLVSYWEAGVDGTQRNGSEWLDQWVDSTPVCSFPWDQSESTFDWKGV